MSENIRVAIRFRPLNKKEENKEGDFYLKLDSEKNTIDISENSREVQKFIFDHVFDQTFSQEKIFNTIAKNTIDWVCQGYNATIFAYGATSSGKSYTMFGSEGDIDKNKKIGIIPRTCQYIFESINNNENVISADMKCSFLEIYREHIRDLLNTEKGLDQQDLKLRQNPSKGVYVQGLIEKYVYTPQDILQTINEGTKLRTVASTSLNSVSSRSHAVLTLTITQKISDGSEIVSKLHLIDLAGSENVGRSEVQGISLAEAQTINKSLSCLGNVIYALTEKGREHIPYRDSKLTFLLQDSLGGNSKTVLIATASPSLLCYSETINTLKFAKRVKEIKNIPKINKNESIASLYQIIDSLNKKIAELEEKCANSQNIIQAVQVSQENNSVVTEKEIILQTKCQQLENKIISLQEEITKLESNKKQEDIYFEKQRNLSIQLADDLCSQRVQCVKLQNELDYMLLFHAAVVDTLAVPELITENISRLTKLYELVRHDNTPLNSCSS